RIFREPIAEHLSEGWQGSKEQVRWLFNGGSLGGSVPNIDLRRMQQARELLPHFEVLGGCLPDTICHSKLTMQHGWLACRETECVLRSILPSDWLAADVLIPGHEMVSATQYYRKDKARSTPEILIDADTPNGDV